jgi:hypothetical protein
MSGRKKINTIRKKKKRKHYMTELALMIEKLYLGAICFHSTNFFPVAAAPAAARLG